MTVKAGCHLEGSHSHDLASLAAILRLPLMWMKRVRDRRELMQLLGQPEYIVRDIGLDRADITREGLKPFWKE